MKKRKPKWLALVLLITCAYLFYYFFGFESTVIVFLVSIAFELIYKPDVDDFNNQP